MKETEKLSNCPDDESIERRTKLFYELVFPYRNLIYHLCIKYTGENSNIEDNYNEVLVNFFRYILTYDPTKPIRTWIYAVTARCIFDLESKRRRFQRAGDIGLVDVDEIPDELLDDDHNMTNCMSPDNIGELYSDPVLEALNLIRPIYKEAFLLQLAGFKLEEITGILHQNGSMKTPNIETTKSRIFLAKKQLRELLNRNGTRKC